jgi:DNA-directed RNA polymerase sigma subunit (sigma70/sigma32)
MDLHRISELLRKLSPRQEKVIRLYFGLGCQLPHSAQEMAAEFGVSAQVIAGILGAAERRLAKEGLSASQLREGGQREARLHHFTS